MESIIQYHEITAAFIARVFLGFLFFFQGYDAVFNIKVENVIQTYENSFEKKGIPNFLIVFGAWFTSYAELIGGLLLILGLFEYVALYLLGVNLLLVNVAFGISNPMWDMKYVSPRLALILFLLIIPTAWNKWSADFLLFNN